MIVDETGVPFSIQSSEALPDYVVRVLAQWRYSPYKKDGKSVPFASRMIVPFARTLTPAIERHLLPTWSAATAEIREAMERGRGPNEARAEELHNHLPDAEALGFPRTSLLVFYTKEDANDIAEARRVRAELLKWLVEHFPQDEILGSHFAVVNSSGDRLADPKTCEELARLWIGAVGQYPTDQKVRLHALTFLQASHSLQALEVLAKIPEWSGTAEWAGRVYGLAALGVTVLSPEKGKALAADRSPQTMSLQQTARQRLLASENAKTVLIGLQTIRAAAQSLAAADNIPEESHSFCPDLLAHAKALYPQTAQSCDTADAAPGNDQPLNVESESLTRAKLVTRVPPVYPSEAKQKRLQGTVTFSALINKSGAIEDLRLKSGPFVLYSASFDAVRKWQYRPTTINGQPVDTSTTATVNFSMGR